MLLTAETLLWNAFVLAVATYLTFWEVVGFKQLAYAERGCNAIGGEYILIALVAIGIAKVADGWMK